MTIYCNLAFQGGKVRSIYYLFILLLFISYGCGNSLPENIHDEFENIPSIISYNNHVKPILSDRCYACHGPDENSRKAGLRLDIEDAAFSKLENGHIAFVRKSISKSHAISRMISSDPTFKMPPPESELKLDDREIAIIAKWLDQGAKWEPHWSLITIKSPAIPEVKNEWVRNNEIDFFIQSELISKDLEPSERADKERLLRRVKMDLTGLPPTIEEIDDFLDDKSDNAYEKVVDRLLITDAYAERMASEWMDVARYADSHGVSFDGYKNSWPYREWVIKAFQKNLHYDDFITHQVAGDLIENPDKDSKLATAFYRMNPMEASQGSIPEEFRMEYISERTGLTGTAFLGLTVECARCHDHKFDPISQKEFYQISSFFNNTVELGLGPTDKERAPTLLLYNEKQISFLDSIDNAIYAQESRLHAKRSDYADVKKYIKNLEKISPIGSESAYYPLDKIKTIKKEKGKKKKGKKQEFEDIQIVDNNKKAEATLNLDLKEGYKNKAAYFDGEYDYLSLHEKGEWNHYDPFSVSTWINLELSDTRTTQTILGNSVQYIGNYRGWDFALNKKNQLVVQLIHRLPDEFISVVSSDTVNFNQWHQVGFSYDGSRDAKGVSIFIDGIKQSVSTASNSLKRSISPINPYTFEVDTMHVRVGNSYRRWTMDKGLFKGYIDEIRLYDRELSELEMNFLGEYTAKIEDTELWKDYVFGNDKNIQKLKDSLRENRIRRVQVIDSIGEIMVMEEMENPRKTFLLKRGLYNQYGEEVHPGGINNVLAFDESLPKNRLGLAKWLIDPDNPLVSRVAVNRYWQMIFGVGLVETAEDFGIQGKRPSHPELLDWLAREFMENNWDVKYLLKLMVMSATYQQSSFGNKKGMTIDPKNVYLSRSHSYRLPAEFIRDNALASSGLLYNKIGGPSVKPYQPGDLWKELDDFSYTLRSYKQDSSLNSYRRTMYTFTKRFAPHPFLTTFDATAREICNIRRDVTNSPLQALILMNDPQIVEASRILSERTQLEACEQVSEQIVYAFRLATGLTATEDQVDILKDQYESSLNHFTKEPKLADSILQIGIQPINPYLDKVKTAALTMVTNTIFNYNDSYMKR
jgi:hypothetical protein